jgi:cation diffusion facilitator family transporter
MMETGERRYDRTSTRRVLVIILVLNIAVCVAKFVAGFMANSLAVISDAVHSTIDALNNVFGIVLIQMASKEPDAEHPYGHGKIETLGAFSIAGFMLITCYEITKQAGARLIGEETPEFEITTFTLVVVGVTLLVNIFVVLYEKAMARKYESEFLYADAVHTQSDVLVTVSVLMGLPFIMRGYLFLDAALALVVAGLIGWSVYRVLQRTVPALLDAAAVDEGVVRRVALGIPGVVTTHDIRSRMHGGHKFVELTLVVAENDLRQAHDITEELENKIVAECGPSSITIHIEPVGSAL